MLLPLLVVGRCYCHLLIDGTIFGWCCCHFVADVIATCCWQLCCHVGWCYCHCLLINGTNCIVVADIAWIAGHTNTLTPSVLEIIKINIFFRPGRSHVRNWQKLVLSLKILVLLKRIFDLHISKQNEKHPYTYISIVPLILLSGLQKVNDNRKSENVLKV